MRCRIGAGAAHRDDDADARKIDQLGGTVDFLATLKFTTSQACAIRAELIGDDTCTAAGMSVRAEAPVLALCRKLLGAGFDPNTPLQVYRADTLCLTVASIAAGARLAVKTGGNGAPIFVFKSAPGGAAAPLVRSKASAHVRQPEQGAIA
jgi:hypothetical protein